ncbi:MAG: formylglycine-generating enzyme family protein [Magnetococcales bacterium]|nr:formylglycine-generating enzyme family protein [Magnetococcales bacterium]NGZ28403.1 formylglycine-generating enzyme family protein [Magnetococcales bacterium]
MDKGLAAWAAWPRQRFKKLDALPKQQARVWGLVLGLGIGALLGLLPLTWFGFAFVAVVAGVAVLAYSSEPLALVVAEEKVPKGFVSIPAGAFWMGSEDGDDDEKPRHRVHVDGFQCQIHPVTVALYHGVMGSEFQGDGNLPVTKVSWFDAVEFCNRWSLQEGFTPCYGKVGDKSIWNQAADGFRLLTEAEWEYACRAGSETTWFFGDDESKLQEYAWFGEGWDKDNAHPVGQKLPNPYELYDMHGNVWEWCWDWYGAYSKEEQFNPAGQETGEDRCLRGGSFANSPDVLRSAFRSGYRPVGRDRFLGFRCGRFPSRQHGLTS